MEVKSIEAVVTALNEANIEYLVVGGLAVNAHGYARFTHDLDLVIGLQPNNIIRGLHALQAIGYHPAIPVTADQFANAELRAAWRQEKNMVVLKLWCDIHSRTPVDVFAFEPFDFAAELNQAMWQPLGGALRVPIVRYETLCEMKRASARPQDLADVANLDEIRKLKRHGERDS
jgi:hypothetical protein